MTILMQTYHILTSNRTLNTYILMIAHPTYIPQLTNLPFLHLHQNQSSHMNLYMNMPHHLVLHLYLPLAQMINLNPTLQEFLTELSINPRNLMTLLVTTSHLLTISLIIFNPQFINPTSPKHMILTYYSS